MTHRKRKAERNRREHRKTRVTCRKVNKVVYSISTLNTLRSHFYNN